MKTINYERCNNLIHITLDNMYSGDPNTIRALDENLTNIINTEAPLTLNTLKARLREAFDVKKISGKALDIIMDRVNKLGFKYECAGICFMQYSFNHVIEGSVDGVNHGFSIDVLIVLE
jgi:hypothetical protein